VVSRKMGAGDKGEEVIEVVDGLPTADRRSAFANAPMGVALSTPAGVLLDANPALTGMVGRTADELHGVSVLDLVAPDAVELARKAHAMLGRQPGRTMRLETRLVSADGRQIPVQVTASQVAESPEGLAAHMVLIVEDITERKALEAELVHRSLHDQLTGLPNRFLFQDRLRHALDRGHRENTPTCVLIIDLDGFKAVNDEHGHPMGDAVLVAFAGRLTSVLRASDTAARLGGDEFAIVCENTERPEAEVLADRVRTTVTDPLMIGDLSMSIGMSIGIGSAPGGADPDEFYERVVREADDAMYADKSQRRRP